MLARNDCSESRFMWMRTREEARVRSFRAVVPLSRVSKTKCQSGPQPRARRWSLCPHTISKKILGEVLGCNAFCAGAA